MEGKIEDKILEIIVAFASLAAAVSPLIISKLKKRNYINKSHHLINLLKTKRELEELIVAQEIQNSSVVLKNKLTTLNKELDEEINSIEQKNRFQIYFIVMALEILIVYSNVGNLIIYGESWENNIKFFQGIFKPPISRIILIFIVFIIASLITFKIGGSLKSRYKDYWKYNFVMLGLYNLVLIGSTILFAIFLTLLDLVIPWF